MCQLKPGPRCASHTRNTAVTLSNKEKKLQDCFNTMVSELSASQGNAPKAMYRRLNEVENRIIHIHNLQNVNKLDYYGTPTGQKELVVNIENAKSTKEKKNLSDLQKKSVILRSWRKNASKLTDLSTSRIITDLELLVAC